MKGEALQRVLLLRFYSYGGILPPALDRCDENGVATFNSVFLFSVLIFFLISALKEILRLG